MQHGMFYKNRHNIGQPARPVEAFLGQQVGMARAEKKNAQILARRFRHFGRHFQQFCALTGQDAGLEFADCLEIIVKRSIGN